MRIGPQKVAEHIRLLTGIGPNGYVGCIRHKTIIDGRFSGVPVLLRGGTDDRGIVDEILRKDLYRLPQFIIEQYRASHKITLLDIGAHIGLASIRMLSQLTSLSTGGSIRLHAVEPDHENYGLLEKNMKSFPNTTHNLSIQLHNAAIADRTGKVGTVDTAEGTSYYKAWTQTTAVNGGDIDAFPLDEMIQNCGGRVDVCKFDAEGAERLVNWYSCLPQIGVLYIETHEGLFKDSSHPLLRALGSSQFRLFSQHRNDYCFINNDYTPVN